MYLLSLAGKYWDKSRVVYNMLSTGKHDPIIRYMSFFIVFTGWTYLVKDCNNSYCNDFLNLKTDMSSMNTY